MLAIYLSVIETQDDKDKFAELYIRYRKQMLSTAYSFVHNTYDAEDIVHNTFITVARNINFFDDINERKLFSYLICSTKGHAQNFIKKSQHEKDIISRYINKMSTANQFDLQLKVEYDSVIRAINKLNDIYSTVLYLYYVEELTYKEVAKLLNRKPDTVRKQIERGKRLLYAQLKEDCDE